MSVMFMNVYKKVGDKLVGTQTALGLDHFDKNELIYADDTMLIGVRAK